MTDDQPVPGFYDDGTGRRRWWDGRAWTQQLEQTGRGASRAQPPLPTYVVLQVVLKERFLGTGSGTLIELEGVINAQASRGYRLHTITTAASGSKGLGGGDRIQATMVFERLDLTA